VIDIVPLGDRVLVCREAARKQTESGLFLPREEQQSCIRGKVLAVGPGRLLECGHMVEPGVSVGDWVLYGKFSGVTVSEEDGLVMLAGSEVLAVFK